MEARAPWNCRVGEESAHVGIQCQDGYEYCWKVVHTRIYFLSQNRDKHFSRLAAFRTTGHQLDCRRKVWKLRSDFVSHGVNTAKGQEEWSSPSTDSPAKEWSRPQPGYHVYEYFLWKIFTWQTLFWTFHKYPKTSGLEAKVYEFVARRFLACLSRDATGSEVTCRVKIETEEFEAKGLTITDRGYLDVYPYDKWGDKHLPQYRLHEEFVPHIDPNEGNCYIFACFSKL